MFQDHALDREVTTIQAVETRQRIGVHAIAKQEYRGNVKIHGDSQREVKIDRVRPQAFTTIAPEKTNRRQMPRFLKAQITGA